MKLFWANLVLYGNKLTIVLFGCVLFTSCATHHPQYGSKTSLRDSITTEKKPEHRLYLIGDAGYANEPHTKHLLRVVSEKLAGESKNTSLLYLGDNIYPLGMPPKKDGKDRKEAEASLDSQMALAKIFKGKTFFIPGNHDWYHGLKGLEEENDYIEEKLGDKKSFLPGKGCGIDDIELEKDIVMIVIDSQWFIEDWDDYPVINDDCDIKTREGLFVELESLLNKNQNKTVVLAIHHPLMSNGTHGGEFSMEKQLFPTKYKVPLPVIGSVINIMRKASGYSTQDIQSRVYTTLSNRIKTLIQDMDNVVVVSGHDHNLQYISKDNIHQIVSGAGSKMEAARAVNPNDFSYGGTGYVILDIYKDGTAKADYYAVKDGEDKKLYEVQLLEKHKKPVEDYPDSFPATVQASIYTPEMTQKSGLHNFLFGKHYRELYSRPINVKTVEIDTLYGGLKTDRAGGGHQSKSLRLVDKDKKEYVMRGLKKSATQFLQSAVFADQFIGDSFEDTYAEDFLMDFYTTSHPYMGFVTDDLAESAGIYHTNPDLYYIPKQDALGEFNEEYGDELYMVEERPIDEHKDLKSFGNPDAIEGTEDVFSNLHKSAEYKIDEPALIRARLFDMLIGDWDRHPDQWRWARFDDNGMKIYKPIPRDRDQAFPKYGGALLSLVMNIPALRHMQNYKYYIRNIKWLNRENYPMDLAFVTRSDEETWLKEAATLQEMLTDKAIDDAFATLPPEMQDETMATIKDKLKKRRELLPKFARDYREVLLKTVVLTGTDKKDKITIERLPDGKTSVQIVSLANDEGKETVILSTKIYNRAQTKEIWIYALDEDDIFEVKGEPDDAILIRLLGGQNNDKYVIENGKKVKIYDFKSKDNTFEVDSRTRKVLTDDYQINSYDFMKPAYNVVAGYPMAGYNPDDGVKIGAIGTFAISGFNKKPHSQKHVLKANYFFATEGFELGYRGEFMSAASKWNFAVDGWYTSPNFSINYFGYGNETENDDDALGMDYNRVKLQVFRVTPSLYTETRNGSKVEFSVPFETIEVDGTTGRFVNQPGAIAPALFEHRQFGSAMARYTFANYDNVSLPSLGMGFGLTAGWTTSFDDADRNFGQIEGSMNFVHKLTRNQRLVFNTTLKGKTLISDGFEFYQAAVLGGDNDLRGFRRERFTGKHMFFQSSDVRLTLGTWKSMLAPTKYGLMGGFDYGRVWIKGEESEKWHNSYGGGIFINAANLATASLSYFQSSDGGRIAFRLLFGL